MTFNVETGIPVYCALLSCRNASNGSNIVELTNSKRVLRSASYVLTELTPDEQQQMEQKDGRALEKINFIRQLRMSPEDVTQASHSLAAEREFQRLGETRLGQALANLNHVVQLLDRSPPEAATNLELAKLAATIPAKLLLDVASHIADRATMAHVDWQIQVFEKRMKTAPVGRLHLERIEMYPAGVQRGELMFTVPLAPKETITISHKEWSTSGEEYERIVQDYFESYSERGVAEKTDVSMSTENESKHASTFNFSASATGSYGPVSMSVAVGLTQSSETREAQKQSLQRTREVTEKASARTRQEHKVSAKLETKRGVEDSSFRTITNPLEDKAMRIDYYRMMRKWRTDLYRYGLRLTFDIAIPNPGARLWALYRRVRQLDLRIRKPFSFSLKPQDLTDGNWQTQAATYGAVIDPPPAESIPMTISRALQDPNGGMEIFDFLAPEGYVMDTSTVTCNGLWTANHDPNSIVLPPSEPWLVYPPNTVMSFYADTESVPGMIGGSVKIESVGFGGGRQASWFLHYPAVNRMVVQVRMEARRAETALQVWKNKSWTTLRDTAFAAWQAENARLQSERDRLWMELAGKDTLTLRRLEREELIRQTLHWLIGVDFDPTPADVGKVVEKLVSMEQNDLPDDLPGADMFRRLTKGEWAVAAGFGDLVKFIHHAVEWENLLYFLYPYFWGSDDVAREKMLFEHTDPTHREFLRAGYARVVVPIRPGFEETFTQLLDTGVFSGTGNSPYLTIAEEVAAFARTNYAGVPPANPEKHSRPLLYPEQRKTWTTMQRVVTLLEAYYETNEEYPDDLSVLAGAPYKDAWGNNLDYRNPGSGNDYDLVSLGADGSAGGEGLDADISAGAAASLVASWFDYTPTSGIDIVLNTDEAEIA